jgi:hypothetical protein
VRKVVVACLVFLVVPAGAVAQGGNCDANFHIVHELGGSGELYDIEFSAPNEGWAVGFDYANDENGVATLSHGPQERPWVVHFDHDSFESITPPHESGIQLASVEVIASNDIYAAGYRFMPRRRAETVVYHWDGIAWARMETPSPGVRAYLRGVVAVAPTDIWTVGHFSRRGEYGSRTLVLHFDGTEWERFRAPSPERFSTLNAVGAASPGQVWAVGGKGTSRPLVLRWNGTEWLNVQVPHRIGGTFEALDVVARNELWASGRRIVRYADRQWRLSKTPDLRGSETYFDVAVAGGEVWSVGHRFVLRPYETVIPLAVHRSGGEWQRASFEGDRYGHIDGVALDSTGAAWAVGETFDPEGPDVGDVIEKACSS